MFVCSSWSMLRKKRPKAVNTRTLVSYSAHRPGRYRYLPSWTIFMRGTSFLAFEQNFHSVILYFTNFPFFTCYLPNILITTVFSCLSLILVCFIFALLYSYLWTLLISVPNSPAHLPSTSQPRTATRHSLSPCIMLIQMHPISTNGPFVLWERLYRIMIGKNGTNADKMFKRLTQFQFVIFIVFHLVLI